MSKSSKRSQKKLAPLVIALLCIVLGLIGLGVVNNKKTEQPATSDTGGLKVIQGQGQATQQSQNNTGSQLQQAAKTNQLINGKDGNSVQRGGSVDTLLKDKTLK